MRFRSFFLALMLAAASLNPASAAPPEEGAGYELLSRISLSFSDVPFNIQSKNVKINLANVRYVSCEVPWICRFVDADNISHNFEGEEGRLANKSLGAYDFDKKPIGALGIGMLRQKSEVLKQVSLFLRQTEYACKDMPTIMAGGSLRYSGNTNCTWKLSTGYVWVGFNKENQLTGVNFSSIAADHYN